MATVSSVLPQSMTRTSSAQAALSMAAPMWADSLSVMIVTETAGTNEMLPERHLLHRFEVDARLDVVENRAQLVVACLGEVALRLEDEEAGRRAGGELPLFGVETALGELARRPRGLDALLVGEDLARRLAHL